ncbi:MAG: outer membrane lipoprotein chaperone LolA [Coxiellaceae bacterium]|nr:MAG: outer membrane lipoprotein chaperone LolA [Coxiellaceae bacterium]
MNNFQSMQAGFTQILSDSNGNKMQQTQGIMALSRPGKFHWEITNPTPQLLVADGHYLWIYDKSLSQATKQTLSGMRTSNPASLLSGSTDTIQKRFDVKKLNNKQNMTGFQLQPKMHDDIVQWIQLYFQQGQLKEMRIADNLGQLSTFRFSNVKLNQNLNPALFRFKPPRGVDVISE